MTSSVVVAVTVVVAAAITVCSARSREAAPAGQRGDGDGDRDRDNVGNSDGNGDDGLIMYDALHAKYRNMAPWYDSFWGSYLDATLGPPLNGVVEAVLLARRHAVVVSALAAGAEDCRRSWLST
jgi:hypothetical protein